METSNAVEKRPLGPLGRSLSVVGLGTYKMEGDGPRAVEALRRGLEAGADHIDTAEMYGSGRVEEIVAEAIAGKRDRVFLTSKVLPSHASHDKTIAACEASLRRLKTDRLDLYLLHWREQTPLEETFRAFGDLKRDGKILAFGVSNFDVADMEEAYRILGRGQIACNQVLYHLEERAIEFGLLPWCQAHDVALVAYSPLGHGKFPRHPVLEEIAKSHDATPAQVALAFLLRNPGSFVIPKTSDGTRAAENVAAGKLRLSQGEIRRLDAAFPARKKRHLPTL